MQLVLVNVVELIGVFPIEVMGSIPGQGTRLGCRFGSQLGCQEEATDRHFSLPLMFLSLSPCPLKSGSTSVGEVKINK